MDGIHLYRFHLCSVCEQLPPSYQSSYLKGAFILKVVFVLFLTLISHSFAYFLSHTVFLKPDLTGAITLAVLCGAALNFFSLRASIYQAREDFKLFVAFNASFYISVLILLLLTLGVGLSLRPNTVFALYLGGPFS